ncbi:hypothetical protein A3F57_04010 [Candidatus Roizmanbacteria bacterium RIFCSPHIGHO2_12_FULL_36_11]|nr:MAG: hypothetical protein A3F57_04010 [Candidatus Roizmanbacteria bacterium RIFCSPHIGHO2_12_FULL_36_11]
MKISKTTVRIILLLSILIISNFIWLKLDTQPPHWDFAVHLSYSMNYLDSLKNFDLKQFFLGYSYWPPLTYYITDLFFLIFGINERVAVLSLTPFLVIMVVSIFKLGDLLGGKKLGWLSLIVLIGIPSLMSQAREYLLDLPLTAMFMLNTYLFLKSDFFSNQKYSVLFGITSGLGLLTKWSYGIFLAGFFLLIGLRFLKKTKQENWINLMTVLFFIASISGPWYSSNFFTRKDILLRQIIEAIKERGEPIFSVGSSLYFYHFYSLYFVHFRFPLTVFLVIGLAYLLFNLKKNVKTGLVLFVASFYFAVLSVYPIKDPRYVEPITPLLVIIISLWVVKIKGKLLRRFLLTALIGVSIFNYISSTFGIRQIPETLEFNIFNKPILFYQQKGYTQGPPVQEDWRISKLVKKIAQDIKISAENKTSARVIALIHKDKMFYNKYTFGYYARLYFPRTVQLQTFELKNRDCQDVYQSYPDYLIINLETLSSLQQCLKYFKDYEEIGNNILPDKTRVVSLKLK